MSATLQGCETWLRQLAEWLEPDNMKTQRNRLSWDAWIAGIALLVGDFPPSVPDIGVRRSRFDSSSPVLLSWVGPVDADPINVDDDSALADEARQSPEVPTVWIDRDGSRVRVLHDTVRMAASLGRLWLHHRIVPVRMPSRPAIAPATRPATAPAVVADAVVTDQPVVSPIPAQAAVGAAKSSSSRQVLRNDVGEGGLRRAS